ncbi:GAF domain-containing protein [Streptomyces sp. WAC 06783]|uniref:GAF domain-containing protein n=1 Tax=Streptomyces sp. WAC 06783 TaxID=2203211 RepID=UPI00163C314B|nr:GAF domain-containing protein [Streptomyces sp. WAC 06783]
MKPPRIQAVVLAVRFVGHTQPAQHLGEACQAALNGAYAVGLPLAADAGRAQRVSLCAAGTLAARGETLQTSLGEGPCVQALNQRAPVRADDLADADTMEQWPFYAERARAHGIRAVFALPVLSGPGPTQQPGLVLSLYRDRPAPIPAADLHLAQDYADAADLLLLAIPTPATRPASQRTLVAPLDDGAARRTPPVTSPDVTNRRAAAWT